MPTRPRTHQARGTARPAAVPELRDNANARGYTRTWQQFRAAYLAEHPLCECDASCCPQGCLLPATDVDHRRPVRGPDDPAFYDLDNLQALAHACHSRKTARHDGGRRRGKGNMLPTGV